MRIELFTHDRDEQVTSLYPPRIRANSVDQRFRRAVEQFASTSFSDKF